MHMKTVSIIIPLYNKESPIKQTIESVLSQGDFVSEIHGLSSGT